LESFMRSLKRLRPLKMPLRSPKFATLDFLLGLAGSRGGPSGLLVGDLSPAPRLIGRLGFFEERGAWIRCASFSRGRTHFFSSTIPKNFLSIWSLWRVLREPKMISFDRARVNETLILLQSFIRSPICVPRPLSASLRVGRAWSMYLGRVIGPDHRDDDTILVPPLTPVCSEDFDPLPFDQHVRK